MAEDLDFYISYAGRDTSWAEWVGEQLKSADYTFVLDVWHWLPGDNIILARQDALERADQVLALCSAAYFSDSFSEQDWTTAIAVKDERPRRLIPVWIEELEEKQLPELLRPLHPIKLSGLAPAEASRRLLTALAGTADPGSAPSASTASRMPGVSSPAISRIPPRNAGFTGRDGLLVQVRETFLRTPASTVMLGGPGGVGKTQIAIEYAHRFASDYDIAWSIDSERPELIPGQFADLADALGIASGVQDAQLAMAAALTALRDRERWLLVFDNVEDPEQLAAFLPGGKGHVLVTTRVGRWQEIGRLIPVEEFRRAESTVMLTTRVAALAPADADRVAEALGDLPLALAQAVGTLQPGLPATEFLRLLDGHATQVLSEGTPHSYSTPLAAATLVALDKLADGDPAAANLICLCGYLAPESVPLTWFREPAALDLPPSIVGAGGLPDGALETSRAFGRISDIGLGRVDQNGLRLHRLTQAILRDRTAAEDALYRGAAISILTSAAPAGSDDPVCWPEWSTIIPHLILADPHELPAAFRPVARGAARYLLVSGQAKAALAMTRQWYEVWTAELGADDIDTLSMAQNLVHASHDNGDYTGALELQRDVLGRRRRVLGDDHPDTLRSASDLAVTLGSMGQRRDVLTLNQDTYDRRRRVLGEDHPDTLLSASNLAANLNELGRHEEALTRREDNYDRYRRVLGADHPDTLSSASNLAVTLDDLGRYKEALMLHQDTYERSRGILGDDHPYAMRAVRNLAATLNNLGRRKEALALREDNRDRYRRTLGNDHLDTMRSASYLAITLNDLGRRKEALALHQDTCERSRRVLGDDHPETMRSVRNLAGILNDLGQYKEALRLNQETRERSRRVLGEDHIDTMRSANNLAVTLNDLGRRKEALALHQDTYERSRRVLGEDHIETTRSAGNVATTLYALGHRAEALALRQDTYQRRRRVFGDDHPDTLAAARDLAANLAGVGKRGAALRLKGTEPKKSKKRKKR